MHYSEKDDKTLVSLTLLGDQAAYEALVVRYQRAVIAAAYTVTRDHYLAEDAAQDAFVSAWVKLDSLREGEKFGVWVCRISRNRAKNTVMRFRNVLSYEELQNTKQLAQEQFPVFFSADQKCEQLQNGISRLSEKVRDVILLHYVQGLTMAQIADRLSIPIGTVKYRLYEGREKLRKEMGDALNKKETFLEAVMKKVEELKAWRLKADKKGIEAFWNEVLSDVEQLPESKEKHHALADVLNIGFWWCEGKKNDEMLDRIREAAEKGGNEEVLMTHAWREFDKFQGQEQIDYMRDQQIPRLEKAGYKKVEAYVWFWMGLACADIGKHEEALKAYETVLSLLAPTDIYYANAIAAIEVEKTMMQCEEESEIGVHATGEELRLIGDKLCFWQQPGFSRGGLSNRYLEAVLYYASRCDSTFYDTGMRVGETMTATNGNTLTFAEDNATVETATGTFYGCQLWVIESARGGISKTWYKPAIGIVRLERIFGGKTQAVTLRSYHINGGSGLIPFAPGNWWEYQPNENIDPQYIALCDHFEVTSFDGVRAILSHSNVVRRIAINENSWEEMILTARRTYCKHTGNVWNLRDPSRWMERAAVLAQTPYQKTHTRLANNVMQRIFDTDSKYTPGCTQSGHWNFFVCNRLHQNGETVSSTDDRSYSFEWKNTQELKFENSGYSLFYNFIYDIFEDSMGSLWNTEWQPGVQKKLEGIHYGDQTMSTDFSIEDGGTVKTAAGSFSNCWLFRLNTSGLSGGWKYRGGKMEYWFAPTVGLVRAKHYYDDEKRCATYDLVSYKGNGDGYFPIADGLIRKYEAVGLTDGFYGASEYVFCKNDAGEMMLLQNQTGVRNLPKDEGKPTDH